MFLQGSTDRRGNAEKLLVSTDGWMDGTGKWTEEEDGQRDGVYTAPNRGESAKAGFI